MGEIASQQLNDVKNNSDALVDQLDFSISAREVYIDGKFFDRPAELPLIKEIQPLLRKWLESLGMSEPTGKAIVDRLPSYFVYALNQEGGRMRNPTVRSSMRWIRPLPRLETGNGHGPLIPHSSSVESMKEFSMSRSA